MELLEFLPGDRPVSFSFIVTGIACGNEGPYFLFLFYFPVDEFHDLRMIQVQTDILAALRVVPPDLMAPAARSPTLEKAHQAAGGASAASFSFSTHG